MKKRRTTPFMSYDKIDKEIMNYITEFINPYSVRARIMNFNSDFDLLNGESHSLIINLSDINAINDIDLYFKNIHDKLTDGGTFVGIFSRKGKRSYTEILGKLVSSGFCVAENADINGITCLISKKNDKYRNVPSTYGPIIRLKRLGKNGKTLDIYKLRTMYPYSEFLQQYVHDKNSLDDTGKFKNDFRITKIGKFMRKFWIDELPMLFNLLKGDLKLVGVRPISFHYFSLYDNELQRMRLMVKPGLLPPFYADMPNSLDEIMNSEKKYLMSYIDRPMKTDVLYFFKIIHNIIIKKARSK